jgi:acyl dehydratase
MVDLSRKPVEYECMEVGEVLGPIDILADDHFVKSVAFAVDDYNPWYFSADSPFGRPVVHPSGLLCGLLRLLYTRYDPDRDRGLHQKEEFRIHSPLFVGETVRLTGRFAEKYVKRQRGYVVTEAEARTVADDRLIISHRAIESTEVQVVAGRDDTDRVDTVPLRRVEGVYPAGALPLDALPEIAVVGQALVGPRKTIQQDQMSIYSGAHLFWRSIHTDLGVARESGLEGTVAQGLMQADYLSEWATRMFGAKWFTTGQGNLTFLRPVLAGETLQVRGVVSDVRDRPEGSWIEIETWVENDHAERVAVGWFSSDR